ncbi:MAG: hypothetical protein IIB17_00800 [Chloroflexi bacterium]|nr:hypothetical protein [Chloroflexota bacterium]
MNNPQTSMEQFELDYNNALAMLAERHPEDGAIDALLFAEEARPNSGSDNYAPEWIQPFVSVVANLAQDHFMRMAASTGGLALGHSPGNRPCVGQGCTIGIHRRALCS